MWLQFWIWTQCRWQAVRRYQLIEFIFLCQFTQKMISIKWFEHWSGPLGGYFMKSIVENKVFNNGFKNYTVPWHSRKSSYNNDVQKANLSYSGMRKAARLKEIFDIFWSRRSEKLVDLRDPSGPFVSSTWYPIKQDVVGACFVVIVLIVSFLLLSPFLTYDCKALSW